MAIDEDILFQMGPPGHLLPISPTSDNSDLMIWTMKSAWSTDLLHLHSKLQATSSLCRHKWPGQPTSSTWKCWPQVLISSEQMWDMKQELDHRKIFSATTKMTRTPTRSTLAAKDQVPSSSTSNCNSSKWQQPTLLHGTRFSSCYKSLTFKFLLQSARFQGQNLLLKIENSNIPLSKAS